MGTIPVEKSNNICVKFGHFAANSCSTVCVINSIGNSMYRSDAANRTEINDNSDSSDPTCNPDTSGRSDTFFHSFVSYATVRQRRQIFAIRHISK